MRVLKDNELKTFEQLLGLSQPGLKKVMSNFLKTKYSKKNECTHRTRPTPNHGVGRA